MKTKKCRLVLVEATKPDNIYNILLLQNNNLYQTIAGGEYRRMLETGCKPTELILISLDPEEKIEEGDLVYEDGNRQLNYDLGIYRVIKICDNSDYMLEHTVTKCTIFVRQNINKIIATQEQLSPETIEMFITEYNSGNPTVDVEIEMEELSDMEIMLEREDYVKKGTFKSEPKLTNGFITIVKDELIGYPLDYYIKQKHSQDRCIGFIDGYKARKAEEQILYTEEEVKALYKATCERLTNSYLSYDIEWFENNKKK